jgi:hypothetical protein
VRHGAVPLATDRCDDLIHQKADGGLLALSLPPAASSADALAHADAGVLRAVREAVEGGVRRSVEIHTGTRVLVLDTCSRWRLWRRSRPLDPVTA